MLLLAWSTHIKGSIVGNRPIILGSDAILHMAVTGSSFCDDRGGASHIEGSDLLNGVCDLLVGKVFILVVSDENAVG